MRGRWAIPGALVFLLAAAPVPGSPRRDTCDLRGPLSDFWPKVVRDWARRLPQMNAGALQIPAWVSLVYGDADPSGAGQRLDAFVREWSRRQEWNWVRSEIWRRRHSRVAAGDPASRLGFRQNLILIGTRDSNPLLRDAAARVGLVLTEDGISIEGRTYRGADLLLIWVGPSPYLRGKYLLGIAGSTETALFRLNQVPFGETDYVLFRGRRLIESGFFEKPDCGRWILSPNRRVLQPDHRGWERLEIEGIRVHFDPSRTDRAVAAREAETAKAAQDRVSVELRLPRTPHRTEIYLYASADEKQRETSDPRPFHVVSSDSAIHRVQTPVPGFPAQALALLRIGRELGERGSPRFRAALAFAVEPTFEGRPLSAWASRLIDRGKPPDIAGLLGDEGGDLRPDPNLLAAAAFLRTLIDAGRVGEVKQLYRNSAVGSIPSSYRHLLGEPIQVAVARWASDLRPAPGVRIASRTERERRPESPAAETQLEEGRSLFRDRRDGDAIRALERCLELDPERDEARVLLARAAFRTGDLDRAIREARRVAESPGADREARAWARLTLGRVEAMRGRIAAAELELRDPVFGSASAPPRRLADLWLENLGFSPNRKAVEEQLRFEARVDLMNFDWDAAEHKLRAVLADNPDDPSAHFALADVYLSRHQYWFERARLINELHPGASARDPFFYRHLADRADREMEKGIVLSTPELSSRKTEGNRFDLADGSAVERLDLFDASIRLQAGAVGETRHHFFRGRSAFFAGDWQKARQELRLSLGTDGTNQRIVAWDLVYLGFLDLFEGNAASARAHFEAARRMRLGGKVAEAARRGIETLRGVEVWKAEPAH
jgi:tetratricopeptide (TPR) repeat protein